VPAADLAIMRRIDALHLDYPFAGSRMLRDLLRGEAVVIGREHVATMMRRMGIEALYRRPNTSKSAPGHKIYPYLLRGLAVERANQVWAMDITYIAMARLCLSGGGDRLVQPTGSGLARVDYDGCRILPRSGWRSTDPARPAGDFQHRPEPAPAKAGGSQFTGAAFTGLLLENAISISMDGRGAWRDNVFVERLWRSVKYEEVYLRAYDSVGEARASLGRYLDFYNHKRPHSSLDARTPDRAYFDHRPQFAAA
jgi:putative transposase